jgi:hypothetical protein
VRREFHPPTAAERGPLLEGWSGQLLRAYGEPASGTGHSFDGLGCWGPADGQVEVDFVIHVDAGFVAVEAKAKTALASKDFAGLRAMHGLAGLERRLVVYLGDRAQCTEDGVDVLPLRKFLTAFERHSLWSSLKPQGSTGRNPGKPSSIEAGAKSVDNKRAGRYKGGDFDAVDPLAFRSADCGDAR